MNAATENPFNITKAVDFSDQQISDYWVDLPESGGLVKIAKPLSPMPMLILGGKGSGKTHLMRFISYSLQRIRHRDDIRAGLRSDGYLGIYMRCGGLNSGRFKNKNQTDDAWTTVFSYYMDLWLAQLTVGVVLDAFDKSNELGEVESDICRSIWTLFENPPSRVPKSLQEVLNELAVLQKELDFAINNCAIDGKLTVTVRATRGRIVFGIPSILARALPSLANCLFVYLIDEFENLSADQQKYVNTLIREKEPPCSFKIGARLYGVRTYQTYSADEENKEGSEFEVARLDTILRENKQYQLFAKRLIVRRLRQHGYFSDDEDQSDSMVSSLANWFEQLPTSRFAQAETNFVVNKYRDRERPYFETLRKKLLQGLAAGCAFGLETKEDIERVLKNLRQSDFPLLEKINIFLFYRFWAARQDLIDASAEIADNCRLVVEGTGRPDRYLRTLGHFKADMLAQLRRECDQKQVYCGLETFIAMSVGLPRNLLILLKHIFSWAVFNGEKPFRDRMPISIRSQHAGVVEGSEWFLRDARMIGTDGHLVQDSVSRLAELLRQTRFADKPAECSCTSFACDQTRVSDSSRRLMDVAQKWSFLINVGERRDKNSGRIDRQFQLNPMLAPRWDLAIFRRGVLSLRPIEVDCVFDAARADEFDEVLRDRVGRMTAPFFGTKVRDGGQAQLWDDND